MGLVCPSGGVIREGIRGGTVKMSEVSTPAPVLSYLPTETCGRHNDSKFVPLMAGLIQGHR